MVPSHTGHLVCHASSYDNSGSLAIRGIRFKANSKMLLHMPSFALQFIHAKELPGNYAITLIWHRDYFCSPLKAPIKSIKPLQHVILTGSCSRPLAFSLLKAGV